MSNLGILLAFGAMFMWGAHDCLMKPLTARFSPIAVAVYKGIPNMLILTIAYIFLGPGLPSNGFWLPGLTYAIIAACGWVVFLMAVQGGLVSLVVPIVHAYIIVVAVLSEIFLGEILTTMQYIAIVIILASVFLLSVDIRELRHIRLKVASRSTKYALFVALLWGMQFTLMKYLINKAGALHSAYYTELLIMIFLIVGFLIRKHEYKKDLKNIIVGPKLIILTSFMSAGAILSMFFASQLEKVAISMGIVAAAPFVTYIIATIFLKEKINNIQKASILLLVFGLFMMLG